MELEGERAFTLQAFGALRPVAGVAVLEEAPAAATLVNMDVVVESTSLDPATGNNQALTT